MEGTWRLDIELGHTMWPGPVNDFFAFASWNQRYIVRVGVGKEIPKFLWAEGFLEYRRYNSTTRYGDMQPWIFERSYVRSEFALYGSLTAFGFLQVGIGAISQSHEEIVYYQTPIDQQVDLKRQPAASRVMLFYIVGFKYDIHIAGEFYVPIGIYSDMFLGEHGIPLPAIRLGISKRFR